jgi:hypothetical protein
MRDFVIDRSKWRCGGDTNDNATAGLGETALLNNEGFMCCLGHIARQLKWPKDLLLDEGYPACAASQLGGKKVNKSILISKDVDGEYDDSEFTTGAVKINDDGKTSVKEKEKLIKALGKKHGLNIKFVGKSVKFVEPEENW